MIDLKKLVLLTLALLTVLCIGGMTAVAETDRHTSGDWEYILLEDGTAEIVGYCGQEEKLTIPQELDGFPVTRLGEKVFFMRQKLTSVTLPEGLISIGDFAFSACESLERIRVPDSVTFIGEGAFSWCEKLYDVNLGNGVATIGNGVFSGCESLTEIILPDSLTEVGWNPFKYCRALTVIQVSPDHPKLAVINNVLFDKTDKSLICYPCALTDSRYSIPQGIRSIRGEAFYSCDYLQTVTIPDSVTEIGYAAFENCDRLRSMELPDSVTKVGVSAFSKCESLTRVTIPSSVTEISSIAFFMCHPSLLITVERNSYAAQFCADNKLNYTYPDANDWLLN